jgi:hypothetical protein
MQIAGRLMGGAGLEGLRKHRELLARWGEERVVLEGKLAGRVPSLARLRAWRAVDVATVRGALPAGGVLVELVRFRPRDFAAMCAGHEGQQPARYLAFVLRADAGGVVMIDLGPAETLERESGKLRAALAPHLDGGGPILVGTGGRLRTACERLTTGAKARVMRSGREIASPLLAPPPVGWLAWLRSWFGT